MMVKMNNQFGHILGKVDEMVDKRHCRFIMIKVRK